MLEGGLNELLKLGREKKKKKEYSRAESYLTRVLEQAQNFADVHNMLGVIYHDRGQFAKAQHHFERALEINPSYTEAALNLAVTYNDLGKYQQAKELFNRAIQAARAEPGELDPFVRGKIANMYAEIGDAYHTAGILDRAQQEFEKALELGPGFVDIRMKLAQVLWEKGERKQALEHLRRIVSEKPGFVAARIQLGMTFYSLGQLDEARAEWQEVLRLDPENKSCRMYIKLLDSTDGNDGQ